VGESFAFLVEYHNFMFTFLTWSLLLATLLDENEIIMLDEISNIPRNMLCFTFLILFYC